MCQGLLTHHCFFLPVMKESLSVALFFESKPMILTSYLFVSAIESFVELTLSIFALVELQVAGNRSVWRAKELIIIFDQIWS